MTNRFTIFLASIFALATTMAQKPSADESFQRSCPLVKIEPQRLPDLNIPRFGQAVFYANGELTVAGGHTSGFIPTPTAEYLKGGEWHLMQMTYNHDDGICGDHGVGSSDYFHHYNFCITPNETPVNLDSWRSPASIAFAE